MNHERGGYLSRSVGWCVLRCSRSGMAPATTGAKALPYAQQVTFQGLVRSICPARRRVPGSRARYTLHRQEVRDSVRGSSNPALKRTAAGSGVRLSTGLAAA
jgi:hypothetical protein